MEGAWGNEELADDEWDEILEEQVAADGEAETNEIEEESFAELEPADAATGSREIEEEEVLAESEDLDEYGFVNAAPEGGHDLSGDELEEGRVLSAGFTNGMLPEPWELALLKGRTFKDWKLFDQAVDEYEAQSGFKFHRTDKRANAARGVCRGQKSGSCKVEISARCMKKTGVIEVRKCFLIHTCSMAEHKFRSGSSKSSWVARKLLNHVRVNPHTPVNDLKETMRSFHEAESERWTVQRARAICRDKITGGTKESYAKIPAYIAALRKVDPNGHAFFHTGEDSRFARLYIAPGSSMNAAKFCRPLVGLDGTHTTGKHPMTLLFATCFDGENHIVILAWAVVKVENGDNWIWFLDHLSVSYPSFRTTETVFISDRDKGLKLGVSQAFPDCNHAHCVQHLRTNIKGNVDVHCSVYFKKLVEARTEAEYEHLLTSFKPANERQLKFVAYVRKISPEVYARFAFTGRRYGHTTSNVVEIINGAVKPARLLPVLHMCNYIWCYIMEKHCERAEHAAQLPTTPFALSEYANNVLNRLFRESQGVKERKSSSTQSLTFDNRGSWAVRLDEAHCDCGEWREFAFPCIHAIRCITNRRLECKEFVGEVWLANTQRQAYLVPVPPLSIDCLPDSEQACMEPECSKKKKGKLSARRKPSWGDQQAQKCDRLVKKQAQACGRCGRPGHNARSCMYEPPLSVTDHTSASVRGRGASHSQRRASHHTLRVGNASAAQRETVHHAWSHFHVRATFQNTSQRQADEEDDGTGPSQVTQ